MPVRITGRHVEITDDISSYIEKKLPRVEKYADRIQKMEVVVEKDRYLFRTELRMKAGPIDFTATAKDSDLLKSVDMLIDKAERQLQKKFEKLRGNKKHGQETARRPSSSKAGTETEEPVATATLAPPKARRKAGARAARPRPLLAENVGVHIFPQTQIDPPVMTIEEAAEELFFTDENFLCFIDVDTNQLGVMFRRKDGHFGVVEPEVPAKKK